MYTRPPLPTGYIQIPPTPHIYVYGYAYAYVHVYTYIYIHRYIYILVYILSSHRVTWTASFFSYYLYIHLEPVRSSKK